ncbi:MAG TPA: MATE family efflux transporter, partial [Woeseiaceae bacterium]|nr:MATE family efflux transporter [Woeseiaceae bacterium]
MILSNVSVPLLGMVDTGVTGHLEDAAYLGAVAIGSTIFGFLYTGVNFLRMGTTGITAQRFGAGDLDGVRTSLGQALIVAGALALALLVLQRPIGELALELLGAGPEVTAYAREYFSIRIFSAPATLANFALIGWFIGLQNARIPLVIVLVTNAVNILLDFVLVPGLGMKVDGVAAATVAAEYSGLAVGLGFAAAELKRHGGKWDKPRLTTPKAYAAFVSINGNLFVRTLALMFTFAFVTAQGARQGGLILAANAILMNMQFLLSFALDGFAHAAEALVGRAVGAGDRDALRRSVSLALQWSLYVALGFCVLFLAGGPVLIGILTDLPEVREATLRYLPWIVLSPLVSVWSFLYDGVFVGATRAREMRDIMLVSAFLVFVPAWYLMQFLGNHGLWLAFLLFMSSRGIGMHYFYKSRG